VDGFFGSRFEADFVVLAQKGKHAAVDVLLDPSLSRKLRPQIVVDGRPVQHYHPKGPVPTTHSELSIERGGKPAARLALKLDPSETITALAGSWQVTIQRDLRFPALVSLLKAAHLSLFALMGYSYALTTGGQFLGWEILGRFACENMASDRPTVLTKAQPYFRQFVNLVRPMLVQPAGFQGTISDGHLFLCTGTPLAWAFMVLIRTGAQMHCVLVPVMEDAESAARFLRFLVAPSPRFEIRPVRFAGDRWEASKATRMVDWPAANLE
jgi:hypothetical protein